MRTFSKWIPGVNDAVSPLCVLCRQQDKAVNPKVREAAVIYSIAEAPMGMTTEDPK